MSSVIEVNYEELQQVAAQFGELSSRVQNMETTLQQQTDGLCGRGWISDAAKMFEKDMHQNVLPSLSRLHRAISETEVTLNDVMSIFATADDEAAEMLMDSQGTHPTSGHAPTSPGKKDPSPVDYSDSPGGISDSFLSTYTEGDGWTYMQNSGFSSDERVVQIGGSCTIYGIMNLLNQEGIDISQEEADAILAEMTERYGRDRAFPLDAARSILEDHGVTFTHESFANEILGMDAGWLLGNDEAAAQQFLVDQIDAGNSVYVVTDMDDSFAPLGFTGDSAHAYTVVGVQRDGSGTPINVLVSTNWEGTPYYTIPMDDFMDDWMSWGHGTYITVP